MAFPPMRAKAPPPAHVLMANSGEDPADDDDTIPSGAPDDQGTDQPPVPGAPMELPSAPGPAAAPNGYNVSSLPSGQGNVSIPDLVQQIQANLTPQELAELGSMLEPREIDLLTRALPMLRPVVTAFMQAEQSAGPVDPNTAALAQDSDALSMTGSQQQYQPDYGAPGGPDAPQAPPPTPSPLARRGRGPLGMVG